MRHARGQPVVVGADEPGRDEAVGGAGHREHRHPRAARVARAQRSGHDERGADPPVALRLVAGRERAERVPGDAHPPPVELTRQSRRQPPRDRADVLQQVGHVAHALGRLVAAGAAVRVQRGEHDESLGRQVRQQRRVGRRRAVGAMGEEDQRKAAARPARRGEPRGRVDVSHLRAGRRPARQAGVSGLHAVRAGRRQIGRDGVRTARGRPGPGRRARVASAAAARHGQTEQHDRPAEPHSPSVRRGPCSQMRPRRTDAGPGAASWPRRPRALSSPSGD